MKTVKININNTLALNDALTIATSYEYEGDLVSGRYAIDAKSIMGIFSLDLSKELTLNIHSDDCADFLDQIKDYIVK